MGSRALGMLRGHVTAQKGVGFASRKATQQGQEWCLSSSCTRQAMYTPPLPPLPLTPTPFPKLPVAAAAAAAAGASPENRTRAPASVRGFAAALLQATPGVCTCCVCVARVQVFVCACVFVCDGLRRATSRRVASRRLAPRRVGSRRAASGRGGVSQREREREGRERERRERERNAAETSSARALRSTEWTCLAHGALFEPHAQRVGPRSGAGRARRAAVRIDDAAQRTSLRHLRPR